MIFIRSFHCKKWRFKYLTGISQGYLAAEESVSDPHSGHCESFPERDAGSGATRVSEGKTFTPRDFFWPFAIYSFTMNRLLIKQ